MLSVKKTAGLFECLLKDVCLGLRVNGMWKRFGC